MQVFDTPRSGSFTFSQRARKSSRRLLPLSPTPEYRCTHQKCDERCLLQMTDVASTSNAAAPMDVDSAERPRFEIKKWNAVAMWSWAICTDTCAICRNNLYEPSIEYSANPTGDPDHPGLSIAWGSCGHVFHLDCIQRWLKTRSACPLCNKEWEFAKIEKILPSGGTGAD